ncbi:MULTISPECIES: hypothetical protein [unclassified Brevundimonas]|uniref:hypothetical protein n=1 Tax=unclassified Brevundimonas TaxID=2622653 RepID=UPI0025BC0E43|nr:MULTISPECIES: hypothetical protein [unclassified Brevundimonas]
MTRSSSYPTTPDGRYFVVRGRLWRCADPRLSAQARDRLVRDLMTARRAVRAALAKADADALATARRAVDAAKVGLGERGPVWWTDGARDLNRHMARNTPYAAWFEGLGETGA